MANAFVNLPYGVEPELPYPSRRVVVFVLGLVSVFFVGFVLGPTALVLARKGRREVSERLAREDRLFTLGFALAIAGTCIGAIMLCFYAFVIFFIAPFGELRG